MTDEQRRTAKAQRQNTRDGVTVVVAFLSLLCANLWDFRNDIEMLLALQGFLTWLIHRLWPTI